MPSTTPDPSDDHFHKIRLTDLDAALLEFYERDEWQGGASAVSAWARDRGIRLAPAFDLNQAVSLLPVRFVQYRRFEFASDGDPGSRPAIIVEAKGEDDHIILDILAADVERPTRLASMIGSADMLGLWTALNPATYVNDKPLRLFRTVENWLRAGCEGSVLIDPHKAWRVLPGLPGLIGAEDPDHGRELLRITHPFLASERILVSAAQP